MSEIKTEAKETNTTNTINVTDSRKDENGTYKVAYDMLKAMFNHMYVNKSCEGAEFVDGSFKDLKTFRNETGWKCTKCEETWRISVRNLRNTISDPKIREFGGYSYMKSFGDLRKVLKR